MAPVRERSGRRLRSAPVEEVWIVRLSNRSEQQYARRTLWPKSASLPPTQFEEVVIRARRLAGGPAGF
eukprot:76497-Alexandrium_andersonii.AAC.1